MASEQVTAAAELKLKVTAIPIMSALQQDNEVEDLEVLVRMEAPLQVGAPHPSIDLVAVVDVSGSMGLPADPSETSDKPRMDYLKAALKFVVNELHDDDRLAIVQFNDIVKDSTALLPISGGGRESARRLVDSLTPDGGAVFKPALEKAVSILQDRDEVSSIRRVPFIVFLSGGEESAGLGTPWDKVISADSNHPLQQVLCTYPIHTFGFSSSHDPMPLVAIAGVSGGTYSYVDLGLDKITDAFAVCLGGLSTVVAKAAFIDLRVAHGVTILGMDSGGYYQVILEGGAYWGVCVPMLYEGEVKNFIVHLRVPRAEAAGEQMLLLVRSNYVDATDRGAPSTTITNDHPLFIQRPADGDDADGQQRDKAVLEQVTRFKLLNLLEKLPKGKELRDQGGKWAEWLRENWVELKNSSGLSSSFDKDVEVMMVKLAEGSGQSFVCSYVSSQQMERATIMGSPENTIAVDYKTPAITRMAEKAMVEKQLEDEQADTPDHQGAEWNEEIFVITGNLEKHHGHGRHGAATSY